eukprot:478469-Karenia_brevis.AAC.1
MQGVPLSAQSPLGTPWNTELLGAPTHPNLLRDFLLMRVLDALLEGFWHNITQHSLNLGAFLYPGP